MSTNIYIDHYIKFSCIGGECPFTCCGGWGILLQDSEIEMYRNLPKPFSDEIMEHIDLNEKKFILNEDGKCALLTEDGWCRIVRGLGDEKLSATCTTFPRKITTYGSFLQIGVEMVCPVVAGYLLEDEPIQFVLKENDTAQVHEMDGLYLTLSDIRGKLVDMLQSQRGSFYRGKLYVILKIQEYITELYQKRSKLDRKRVDRYLDSYLKPENLQAIYDSLNEIEIKTEEQITVLSGFFYDSLLLKIIFEKMKDHIYFEHLFQGWMVDTELFKKGFNGFYQLF